MAKLVVTPEGRVGVVPGRTVTQIQQGRSSVSIAPRGFGGGGRSGPVPRNRLVPRGPRRPVDFSPGVGTPNPFGLGGIVDFLTDFIPGGDLIDRGIDVIGGLFDRGRGGGGRTGLDAGCPDGFRRNPRTGRCEAEGIRGGLERFIPGGRTGVLPAPGQTGEAVVGAFGLPAFVPAQAGVITTKEGDQRPILRCPTGMVLGKDDLCYPKSVLGARNRFRKHKRAPRPPVTAQDAKAIRRANRVKDKVKDLAKDVGFSCRRR